VAGSTVDADHCLDRALLSPGPAGSIVSHAIKTTGIIRNIPENGHQTEAVEEPCFGQWRAPDIRGLYSRS
jgi:hypothetical protein